MYDYIAGVRSPHRRCKCQRDCKRNCVKVNVNANNLWVYRGRAAERAVPDCTAQCADTGAIAQWADTGASRHGSQKLCRWLPGVRQPCRCLLHLDRDRLGVLGAHRRLFLLLQLFIVHISGVDPDMGTAAREDDQQVWDVSSAVPSPAACSAWLPVKFKGA